MFMNINPQRAKWVAQFFIDNAIKNGELQILERFKPESELAEVFYSNFNPDDWDFIVISDSKEMVDVVCNSLFVCDFDVKYVQLKGEHVWMGVTYHS